VANTGVTPSEGVRIVNKLGDGAPAALETGSLKGVRVGKVMVPLGIIRRTSTARQFVTMRLRYT
jgi:hypothetical protein